MVDTEFNSAKYDSWVWDGLIKAKTGEVGVAEAKTGENNIFSTRGAVDWNVLPQG